MEETPEKFVSFLDILGFKEFVLRNKHNDVLLVLEKIHTWIKQIEIKNNDPLVKDHFTGAEIKPYIFSDSIILFSNNNTINSARLLLFASQFIIQNSIAENIPIKGAMAYGEITVDSEKGLFFGQPIIDAYLLQEELKYYGLILHNTAEAKAMEKIESYSNLIKQLDTPLKTGKVKHYNLFLSLKLQAGSELNYESVKLTELYKTVSGISRIYVDNTIDMFKRFRQ